MSNYTDNFGPVLNGSRNNSAFSISNTFWGYIIGPGSLAQKWASLGELMAVTGCLFFGTVSFAQWLVPGSVNAAGILPLRVSGTIVFFSMAAFLYRIARRGMRAEAQIDTKRRILRLVRSNRSGIATPYRSFKFSEIESVFIKRTGSGTDADKLYIQISSGAEKIQIARGSRSVLEPLLNRLQGDFKELATPVVVRPQRIQPSRTQATRTQKLRRSVFATV